MENEMIDATLVIDTLPDTPLLSTSSYGIPLMLFLPLAQTSARQIIRDSRGSCYNNYRPRLVFLTDPKDRVLYSAVSADGFEEYHSSTQQNSVQ
jgi:hypothetical protein